MPVVLQCQERNMVVFVVMADVFTCTHFYIWGEVILEVSLVKPSVHQCCRSVFIVSLVLSQTDEVHWAKIKPVLFHPWPFLTHGSLLGAIREHEGFQTQTDSVDFDTANGRRNLSMKDLYFRNNVQCRYSLAPVLKKYSFLISAVRCWIHTAT